MSPDVAPKAAPRTVPGALQDAASRFGDALAVVDSDVRLTFEDLLQQVRETAAGYVALGVSPGDRVAVWAPNSWRWEVAALAVTYAGGVLVPLNTRYTGHEVVDVLARVDARLVVVADGFLDRRQTQELRDAAAEAGVTLPTLVDIEDLPTGDDLDAVDHVAAQVSADDVADILFTSGTTGRSKGARSAHRQTYDAARVWGALGELVQDDRYLVVNPFFHSFGYKVGIVTSLLTGATIHPMPVFDVTEMLRTIERERITVLPGAPAIFQALLDAPDRSSYDLSSLRFSVTGAATVPVVLIERMQQEMGFDLVLTAFGMTECVVATMCRRGDSDELVAGTCGRVIPGLELAVVDPETGAERGPGEEGEVRLRGDLVMLDYLDDPQATAEAIDDDGWLHTGDVGRVDAEGYLKITDRLKDMYICGGFNVYPAEVEQALMRLDAVADVAVVGVPDQRLGEVGKAFVVRRPDARLGADDVTAYAKERLANFKVPREVAFVDALPRNLAGKVLKTQLREGN